MDDGKPGWGGFDLRIPDLDIAPYDGKMTILIGDTAATGNLTIPGDSAVTGVVTQRPGPGGLSPKERARRKARRKKAKSSRRSQRRR